MPNNSAYLNKITRVGWMQRWKFIPWPLWNDLWDNRGTGGAREQANTIGRIIEHELAEAEVEPSERDEALVQALYSGAARVEVKMSSSPANNLDSDADQHLRVKISWVRKPAGW